MVYERFPKVFEDKELREARQSGQIEYYQLRMGPHYSERQLIAYIEKRLRRPCQARPLMPEAAALPASMTASPQNEALSSGADAFTVDEFCRRNDMGRATFYELLKSGKLKAKKRGSRTVVLASQEQEWRNSLPDYASPIGRRPGEREAHEIEEDALIARALRREGSAPPGKGARRGRKRRAEQNGGGVKLLGGKQPGT